MSDESSYQETVVLYGDKPINILKQNYNERESIRID